MIKREVLDAMVAAGCTGEQIAAAVKADMGTRSSNAERQARFRAKKAADAVIRNVTAVTVTLSNGETSPDKEVPRTPKEITPNQDPPDPEVGSGPPIANLLELALAAFNRIAKTAVWPLAQKLTDARRSSLRKRLDDCGGLAGWVEALERAARSSLLTGANDRGWRADIDFFLKPAKFTKLLEGSYDDHQPARHANGSGANGSRSGADSMLAAGRRAYARHVDAGRGNAAGGFDFADTAQTIDERGERLGIDHDREEFGPGDPKTDTSARVLWQEGRFG